VEDIRYFIADYIWPVYLVLVILVGIYLSLKVIFYIQRKTTEPAKVKSYHLLEIASISLGPMIGIGMMSGVLGSFSTFAQTGQMKIEAIVVWSVIGAILMIPFSYSETLCSQIMKKSPRNYISMLLSPAMGTFYAIVFVVLFALGFVGMQFGGMDAIVTLAGNTYFNLNLTVLERLIYILLPMIVIVGIILFIKKQEILIIIMKFFMAIALIVYIAFFLIFLIKTSEHIPIYVGNMIDGVINPINMMYGLPLGIMLGLKGVVQSTQFGLGTLPMAAYELDAEPVEAAKISTITILVSVFISIITTSYIISYGINNKIVDFPNDSFGRMEAYFKTATSITGSYGFVSLSLFVLLTILVTLIAGYYFIHMLFDNSDNLNILISLLLFLVGGALAMLGFELLFRAINLLQFIVVEIHLMALISFVHGYWYRFKH
jgi:hypothetical protein